MVVVRMDKDERRGVGVAKRGEGVPVRFSTTDSSFMQHTVMGHGDRRHRVPSQCAARRELSVVLKRT